MVRHKTHCTNSNDQMLKNDIEIFITFSLAINVYFSENLPPLRKKPKSAPGLNYNAVYALCIGDMSLHYLRICSIEYTVLVLMNWY